MSETQNTPDRVKALVELYSRGLITANEMLLMQGINSLPSSVIFQRIHIEEAEKKKMVKLDKLIDSLEKLLKELDHLDKIT